MKTMFAWVFCILAVAATAAIALVVWDRYAADLRVTDKARGAINKVEEAAMSRGSYLVQLESVEFLNPDWTSNSLTGGPKPVMMTVRQGDRRVYTTQLGAFRGEKTFTDRPVSFRVDYNPDLPISLDFEEVAVLSDGRRYNFREPWPFTRATLGEASTCRFTWRKLEDSPAGGQDRP